MQQGGFKEAEVKSYGTTKDVLVTLPKKTDVEMADKDSIGEISVQQLLPEATIQQVDYIGPQGGTRISDQRGACGIVVALLWDHDLHRFTI